MSSEMQPPKSKHAGGCRGMEMEARDPLVTGEILEELLPISGGTERGSRAKLPLGNVWFLLGQAGSPSTPSPAAGLGWAGCLPSSQQQMPGGRSCSRVSHLHPLSFDLSFVCPDKLNHISSPACCQLLYIDPQWMQ